MTAQGLAVELRGGVQQRIQRGIGRLARFLVAPALLARDFHACRACQFLDGLGKIQVVVVHDEAKGIATGAATKAVIELLVGAHGEGRGLFLVERAAGRIILAGFFQLDTGADHVDDVEAVDEVVNETLGNQPGHGSLVNLATGKSNRSRAECSG